MKRLAWLGLSACLYLFAALLIPPGFFDGFNAASPYCFVQQPPNVLKCSDHPRSGQLSVSVTNGVVDPGSAFTGDGQAELSFRPGAFSPPPSGSQVTISLKPVADYPAPNGAKFLTNVYLITANSKLGSEGALVTLRYSDQLPAPSFIYYAASTSSGWTSIGNTNTAAPFTISANTSALGYFAAGYPSNSKPRPGPVVGGTRLPLLIALGIVVIIVASLPLAFLRRRGADEEEEAAE